jgi:hypothetical protein
MHKGTYDQMGSALSKVDVSQDSIQNLSKMIQDVYSDDDKAHAAVEAWHAVCRTCDPSLLLPLIYVANDVLQYSSRKLGNKYLEHFSSYLVPVMWRATKHSRDSSNPSLRDKVRNVAKILGDRGVYSKKYIAELLKNIDKPENTSAQSPSFPNSSMEDDLVRLGGLEKFDDSPTHQGNSLKLDITSQLNNNKRSADVANLNSSSSNNNNNSAAKTSPRKKTAAVKFNIDGGGTGSTSFGGMTSITPASKTQLLEEALNKAAIVSSKYNNMMESVLKVDEKFFTQDPGVGDLFGDELVDAHAACVDAIDLIVKMMPISEELSSINDDVTRLMADVKSSLQDDVDSDTAKLEEVNAMIKKLQSIAPQHHEQKEERRISREAKAAQERKAEEERLRREEKERNDQAIKDQFTKLQKDQEMAGQGMFWDDAEKKYMPRSSGNGNAVWRDN